MANSYFQFKQFRIDQGQTAMKVTTEACLFGSLIDSSKAKRVLDIGTGTGLISLMIAQKSNTHIDAIELEPEAQKQSASNFANSDWSTRINSLLTDARTFQSEEKYDLIISNPPFFNDHQQGKAAAKNQAIHTNTLSFKELIDCITRNLSKEGHAWILLPEYEMSQFISIANTKRLNPNKIINVYNRSGKPILRQIVQLSYSRGNPSNKDIHIRKHGNDYSQDFVDLLKPYYLHL